MVKIKLENPGKWQKNSAENGPENPENGVIKWLDTLPGLLVFLGEAALVRSLYFRKIGAKVRFMFCCTICCTTNEILIHRFTSRTFHIVHQYNTSVEVEVEALPASREAVSGGNVAGSKQTVIIVVVVALVLILAVLVFLSVKRWRSRRDTSRDDAGHLMEGTTTA